MSELVGNPEDRFSHNKAQLIESMMVVKAKDGVEAETRKHYVYTSMQCTAIFTAVKVTIFR